MPAIIPLCKHIKDDGVRCGSPALRGKSRCFFHDRYPNKAARPQSVASAFAQLTATPNPASALAAVGSVVQDLMAGRINSKQAGVLLYALQVRSLALRD